jgi:hypothetical protein
MTTGEDEQMRDETLFGAFEATYLARFRWLKVALTIPFSQGFSGPNRQVTLSTTQRAYVYAHDKGICYLCCLPVDEHCHDGPWACTVDHIHPLSKGGAPHTLANLALAHGQCNQLKGWSPHPTTLYARERWHCRRCGEEVSHDEHQTDWPWNQPVVERLVPLNAPEIWWLSLAWCCHLRCHSYRLPAPSIHWPSIAW